MLHNSNLMGRSIAASQPPASVLCEVRSSAFCVCFASQFVALPLFRCLPAASVRSPVQSIRNGTFQVRILAGNFGPLSSAAAPSIRGFFQPTNQPSSKAVGLPAPLPPAPEAVVVSPSQSSSRPLSEAHDGHFRPSIMQQPASDTQPCGRAGADQSCQIGGGGNSQPDVDLSMVSIVEQAHILAGIQRRAASASSAASGRSTEAGRKRSRQEGGSHATGQEARSALRKPLAKQRRISDVFLRLQRTDLE